VARKRLALGPHMGLLSGIAHFVCVPKTAGSAKAVMWTASRFE